MRIATETTAGSCRLDIRKETRHRDTFGTRGASAVRRPARWTAPLRPLAVCSTGETSRRHPPTGGLQMPHAPTADRSR